LGLSLCPRILSFSKSSRMREIASTLLFDTAGRFLFQQRDNIAGITEPGKIGLFGGHKEGNETFLECIAREVSEEVGINLPLERFQLLTVYEVSTLKSVAPSGLSFLSSGTFLSPKYASRKAPSRRQR
jgi:8-oxo-dGTP pyrophosphatase MutT (NUDIX family)